MLSNRFAVVLVTALAPMIWGTTYFATTELLPPDRPLLAAVVRALPAGLLLILITRRLPRGVWWWRSVVLGALNIGLFFALLSIAAYRLPGGVAATIGAIQPFFVAFLSLGLLREHITVRTMIASCAGLIGVALLVLRGGNVQLDALDIAAAAGASRAHTRLILVGGAATLRVPDSDDMIVLDDPRFTAASYRDIALACVDQLAAGRAEASADWAYLSPPAFLNPDNAPAAIASASTSCSSTPKVSQRTP